MKLRNRVAPIATLIALSGMPAANAGDVVGKVTVGYQGWFDAHGSGSPIDGWWHITPHEGPPRPGNIGIEMWPDTREYTHVYPTGFASLGNGKPAQLFSDYDYDTVLTHFRWMSRYGIDCAALQRFQDRPDFRNQVSLNVMKAAEATGQKFYIMYDISGWRTFGEDLPKDWTETIAGKLRLTESKAYAREHGKPVVCIWGLGVEDRPGNPATALQVITDFKKLGCYVIGGVGRNFRTDAPYAKAFKACDMLSPWNVGTYKNRDGADDHRDHTMIPDVAFCKANGIDYQPVVFPGFAWSNWQKPPAPRNDFPRQHGDFLWEQFVNVRQAGVPSAYVAMFDEVNEGTAIFKLAEDSSMAPSDQYFLNLDADGVRCSSDFYLRMVGDGTAMVKGVTPLQLEHPTPHELPPSLFRTGFETVDPSPDWTDTPDKANTRTKTARPNSAKPACHTDSGTAHIGKRSLLISGNAGRKASTFRVFDFSHKPLTLSAASTLTYWINPANANGRFVAVDLHFTDGGTLHAGDVTDQDGHSLAAAAGHGNDLSLNQWSQIVGHIGARFAGKKVDRLWVTFDRPGATGAFQANIDDIAISE